jgi:glycosyltransferase involved in cell wall biosynthesis
MSYCSINLQLSQSVAIIICMSETQYSYRIGIDARFFRKETGGIGRYTRELVNRLALLDAVNQYTVFISEKDVAEWTISQPNFETRVVEAVHYTLDEQTKFLKILNNEKLDLVHFLNFNHPAFYTRPFVTTLHDLTVYLYPVGRSQKSFIRRLAFLGVMKHAFLAAKRVISVSENSAHDAQKYLGIPHAKMEVIYEGGPTPTELPFGNKAMVQDYLGSRKPYFLFVSQWRPHKGLITLIEAFDQFKEKTGLPHTLVLTGNQKDCTAEIKERLASSRFTEDILTPGFVSEELLSSIYHNATAYINPSEYEGFGLPILEAFAHGAPVIAARNSSLPEIVGAAGLLFETKNSAELASKMEEISVNPSLAQDLVSKGMNQLSKFSWDRMAQQTLQVYQDVLEKRR